MPGSTKLETEHRRFLRLQSVTANIMVAKQKADALHIRFKEELGSSHEQQTPNTTVQNRGSTEGKGTENTIMEF